MSSALFGTDAAPRREQMLELVREMAAAQREGAADYKDARGRLEDLEWLHAALESAGQCLELLLSYDPASDADAKAVYVVAQAAMSLQSVVAPLECVRTYEQTRDRLAAFRAALHDSPGA